jgi:hypothetical protein
VTHGDSCVNEIYRRGIFGIFQEDRTEYPQWIHQLSDRYTHIRNTLHGVMFLFKSPNSGIINYQLEQYLIWNEALIDEKKRNRIRAEIINAIPIHD